MSYLAYITPHEPKGIVYRIDPDAIVVADVFMKKQKLRQRAQLMYVSPDLGCTTMQESKLKKLEAAGWKVGGVDEFLGLTPEESAYIEVKLALSHTLRQRRLHNKLSQIELAKLVHSSQSRIAKMEAGDPSVSIDLIMKSLLALGASPKDVAKAISSGTSHAA
jgi:DNA-binding XRE family transcriptional regulator